MAGSVAGYQRRQEEWDHQVELAKNDLELFDHQIEGAKARLDIARRELENQELQLANTREVSDYLRGKFTNQELYEWMLEQAAMLHFQSYLLAIDVARQTEGSFHYERMPLSTSFLALEQWSDLGGALMAGERLQHDLRRMEKSFLDLNAREIEKTKDISLAQVDPVALLLLRQSGHCFVSLPEHCFDEDGPGLYMRRIKSVSLSIPSVVGPHTSVNCRLSLVRSEVRINTDMASDGSYPRQRDNSGPDNRFRDVNAEGINAGDFVLSEEMAAIVTSHAQGDSGLFETNLRDERYLPFEGAGAISTWRLELPKEVNRFDLASVADVVIHLRYTSRDGGPSLRSSAWEATFGAAAPASLADPSAGTLGQPRKLMRLFSARDDFPTAWHRFLNPAESESSLSLDLNLSRDRFPYHSPDLTLVLKSMTFLFVTESSANAEGLVGKLGFIAPASGVRTEAVPTSAEFTSNPALASLAACEYVPQGREGTGLWRFEVKAADNTASIATILKTDNATGKLRLDSTTEVNLFLLCTYDLEGAP